MSQTEELIAECRHEIDSIDEEIVTCLVRRINITKDIAGYKKLSDTPILDEDREHQVIDMVRDFTEGLVSAESVEKVKTIVEHVFNTIIDDTRRYEYCCTYDETVVDAEYEGAPKVEPLFKCNSDKYLGIIDKAIAANERETAWSKQYEIDRIKTAMEQLTATLPQINDLFEMHRRLEKAGIEVTRDDILGDSVVQITINHDFTGKYYLCGGKTKLVAMDADGKFYVNSFPALEAVPVQGKNNLRQSHGCLRSSLLHNPGNLLRRPHNSRCLHLRSCLRDYSKNLP